MENNKKLQFLIIASLFLLLNLSSLVFHEMWRDELQAWLIARDSKNILELFINLKYEGHPALWYLLLTPLTKIFSPVSMQILHLSIFLLALYFFIFFSPFSFLQKLLFSIGIFSYEYSIISRNYSLSILFLFIYASCFKKKYEKPIIISIILFFLSHTNILGLIISISIFLTQIFDYFFFSTTSINKIFLKKFLLGLCISFLGILTSTAQVIPFSDATYTQGWNFNLDFKLLEIINKVLVNAFLPPPQHILINTFVVFLENYYIFLIIIIFILYIFIKNIISPNIIIFFCVSLGGLIIFFYTKFLGDTRHHGLIWIIFIISYWLSYKNDLDHIHILRNIRVKFSTIFTLLLIYHSLASIGPRINDYKKPYSNAKLAAEFIKLNNLKDKIIIGHPNNYLASIRGYLDNKAFFNIEKNRFETYFRYDAIASNTKKNIFESIKNHPFFENKQFILITNYPLTDLNLSSFKLSNIAEFTGAIRGDENFYIYMSLPNK